MEDVVDSVLKQPQLFVRYYNHFCQKVHGIHYYSMPFPSAKIALF